MEYRILLDTIQPSLRDYGLFDCRTQPRKVGLFSDHPSGMTGAEDGALDFQRARA
jgi:hypothetical protein